MITESLLVFLTSVMSLNQPITVEKKEIIRTEKQIEVVQTHTPTCPSSMRGGWDHN